jgi:hypothetical protein
MGTYIISNHKIIYLYIELHSLKLVSIFKQKYLDKYVQVCNLMLIYTYIFILSKYKWDKTVIFHSKLEKLLLLTMFKQILSYVLQSVLTQKKKHGLNVTF